jgi:hypothetical protein
VQKNRTFFFGNWQGTRLNTGVVRLSTVPISAQRRGVFSNPVFDPATTRRTPTGYVREQFPNNTIPLSRFDRATLAVLNRYPFPNVFTAAGAESNVNNYRRSGNEDVVADQLDTRIDRYLGVAHRAFARYSFLRDHSRPMTPLPDGSGTLTSGAIGNTLTRADSLAADHTWTVTPSAVNQFRFGYTRRNFNRSAMRTGQPVEETSLIPNLPVTSFSDVLPMYEIVGFQQIGPRASANSQFATSVTQLIDNLSFARGRHSIKAGTDVRLQALDVLQPASPTGNF